MHGRGSRPRSGCEPLNFKRVSLDFWCQAVLKRWCSRPTVPEYFNNPAYWWAWLVFAPGV